MDDKRPPALVGNYELLWGHPIVGAFTGMYEGYSMSDAQRASIDRRNAEALFPRLREGQP